MNAPLRTIDMFAGIGGFSLGLHRTGGFETVAFAEVDPYASRVLAERFPGVPNIGDVTTAEFPDADFICAGFPCQDISFAGAGAGLAGARSGLWREVVRALCVVRPRGALLENVAALLNRGMGTVLGDLAEVGYDAEWHCIPASAVGAPHRRDRIWIVGTRTADAAPVLGASILRSEPNRDHACVGEVADANCDQLRVQPGRSSGQSRTSKAQSTEYGEARALADTESIGWREGDTNAGRRSERSGEGKGSGLAGNGWWSSEPDVGRVADGVPSRVDRLRCLGNAVVPQIPEIIGRAILASADTHPKGGDPAQTGAPFMSGAVPPAEAADAQPLPEPPAKRNP